MDTTKYIIIMTRSKAPMHIKSHVGVKNVFSKYKLGGFI